MGTDAKLRAQVAIVGAGPVGLMLANLLGALGVQVLVLERGPGLLGLPRAIAYDAETLRLFTTAGLYEALSRGLIQNPHVRHLNARGATLMAADFPHRGIYGHSALGTFYQPDLERVLLEGLQRFDQVRVMFGHNVLQATQDENRALVSGETPDGRFTLQADYVVACDGGTSGMRDMLGIRLIGSTYSERWLVADAIVPGHHVDRITFHCDPARPRVELPAVGQRVRWEFMLLPGEDGEAARSEQAIRELICRHTPYRDFELERRAVYTFHARVAERWRDRRIFLAGDAAHLMPPFAGQGMNGGLKDASNLAWKLAAVIGQTASADILDSYETERRPVVRRMVDVSRRLGKLIMTTGRTSATARDVLFACLNRSQRFRSFIGRGGVIPPPEIAPSCLAGRRRDAVIGQMLPQPDVRTASGSVPLDQLVGGQRWAVIGIGVDPSSSLLAVDRARLQALGAVFVAINAGARDGGPQPVTCTDKAFLEWAATYGVRSLLVRPDRFVADRLEAGRSSPVLALMARPSSEAWPHPVAA